MNGNSTLTYGSGGIAARAAIRGAKSDQSANSLTLGGAWLFVIGFAIVMSGIRALRLPIGNLLLQPYLIPIAIAFPIVALFRIGKFPRGPLYGWLLFSIIYAAASLGPATTLMSPLSENLKVIAAIVATVTIALLVKSRTDFIFGSAGLALAVAVLAARGIGSEEDAATERFIDVANKNSYSIYALPAVLLVLYVVLRFDWKKVSYRRFWFWVPMVLCAGLAGYGILSGGNRSGYLGLAFIIFELFVYSLLSRRFKVVGRATAWILVSAITAGLIAVLVLRRATTEFERRIEQTVSGYQSDTLRLDIMTTSLRLAVENPFLGVTPQKLPYEIARRIGGNYAASEDIDTHNVFAHVLGGCGFLCFLSLLAIAWMLWFWRPKVPLGMSLGPGFYDARNLLRMMLLLWSLRGLFTREILYNPGFCMGIGLAIGLCIVEATASLVPVALEKRPASTLLPAPANG